MDHADHKDVLPSEMYPITFPIQRLSFFPLFVSVILTEWYSYKFFLKPLIMINDRKSGTWIWVNRIHD